MQVKGISVTETDQAKSCREINTSAHVVFSCCVYFISSDTIFVRSLITTLLRFCWGLYAVFGFERRFQR